MPCTLVDSNMEVKKVGIVDKHGFVKAPIAKKSNKKYDLSNGFKRKLSVVFGAMNFEDEQSNRKKPILIGSIGSGKSTAINAVSDIPTVYTKAANSDSDIVDKATTTVVMDYGELHLRRTNDLWFVWHSRTTPLRFHLPCCK